MAWSRAAIFAALFFLSCLNAQARAQDVTLTSSDGAVEISGTLLGFDGQFYRVETQFGELTVDGSGVRCDGPGCPNLSHFVAELTLSGASVMGETLLPALIEGFALRRGFRASRTNLDATHFEYLLRDGSDQRVVARFTFRVTTTDEGFADLLANEADVVLALREIRQVERDRAYEAGMGDMTQRNRSRVLALDAMVPIVARDNPIHEISVPDLAKIISGEINNWEVLGGPNAPIALHLPKIGSGLSQAVQDRVLAPVQAEFIPEITRHDISSTVTRAVSTDPFALGIASYSEVSNAKPLTITGSCNFHLNATRRTIKTEDYPLNAPMFLYLPARRLPQIAREFLAYVDGPAAQIVIRRAGFVDQTPEAIPVNAQGDRFANAIRAAGEETSLEELQAMIDVLRPMTRLTTSFRFETGSTRPDAQSRANIAQLARSLEVGDYDAKTLYFVGFSDSEGAADGNRRISLKRAEAVRQAVLENAETADPGRFNIQVVGFGEAMPMACDESDWGRQVNRRVEIWVR